MLQDGIYALGLLSIKQPCGKVDAVATKVDDSTASVLDRVGEPTEEHLVAANLLGSLMAIIDLDACDTSELPTVGKASEMVIGGIPSGFVVGHDLDAMFLGQFLHSEGLLVGCSQWFLHHYVNASRGASLHGSGMVEDAAVIHHNFRLLLVEHLVERGIELLLGQSVHKIVVSTEIIVLLSHSHDDEIAAIHGIDKVPEVSVCHTRYTDSQGAIVCLSQSKSRYEQAKRKECKSFHSELTNCK